MDQDRLRVVLAQTNGIFRPLRQQQIIADVEAHGAREDPAMVDAARSLLARMKKARALYITDRDRISRFSRRVWEEFNDFRR